MFSYNFLIKTAIFRGIFLPPFSMGMSEIAQVPTTTTTTRAITMSTAGRAGGAGVTGPKRISRKGIDQIYQNDS